MTKSSRIVYVSDKNHKQLMILKLVSGHTSLDETIGELLNKNNDEVHDDGHD